MKCNTLSVEGKKHSRPVRRTNGPWPHKTAATITDGPGSGNAPNPGTTDGPGTDASPRADITPPGTSFSLQNDPPAGTEKPDDGGPELRNRDLDRRGQGITVVKALRDIAANPDRLDAARQRKMRELIETTFPHATQIRTGIAAAVIGEVSGASAKSINKVLDQALGPISENMLKRGVKAGIKQFGPRDTERRK